MSPHVHTQGGRAAVLLAAHSTGSTGLGWLGVRGGGEGAGLGVEGQVQRLTLLGPGGGGGGGRGRGPVGGGRAAAPAVQVGGDGARPGLEGGPEQEVGGLAGLAGLARLSLRLLLDVDPQVVSGLEVEGDELDRVLVVGRVLQSHGQHLQSPPHHLQLRVVQPAVHGVRVSSGGGGGGGGSWWF